MARDAGNLSLARYLQYCLEATPEAREGNANRHETAKHKNQSQKNIYIGVTKVLTHLSFLDAGNGLSATFRVLTWFRNWLNRLQSRFPQNQTFGPQNDTFGQNGCRKRTQRVFPVLGAVLRCSESISVSRFWDFCIWRFWDLSLRCFGLYHQAKRVKLLSRRSMSWRCFP